MSYQKMNRKIKSDWIKNLRSGIFIQGRDRLLTYDKLSNQYRFCCLGVLCNMGKHRDERWKRKSNQYGMWFTYDRQAFNLPHDVQYYAGLSDAALDRLVYMNDIKKCDFNQIANWILKNL